MAASNKTPVVVVFGATWGGAKCKEFEDYLNKAVHELKGAATLVKIDVDASRPIAQQLGVQSIPTVLAFFQGQPVDGFEGAVPLQQVKVWLNRLVAATGANEQADPDAPDVKALLSQAEELLGAGNIEDAISLYNAVVEHEPENAAAHAGIIRCLVKAGDIAGAREALNGLPESISNDKALSVAKAAVELAEQANASSASGDLSQLQQKVAANADDHDARFSLALALLGSGQREEAVDALLEIVKRNRTWNEEAARKQLVKMFEAFGSDDPLTIDARRRLSSILFS